MQPPAEQAAEPVVDAEPAANVLIYAYDDKTITEFIHDVAPKLPQGAATIDIIFFADKTRNITSKKGFKLFKFYPARLNIRDKAKKTIGCMTRKQIATIYGENFKLLCFESKWLKVSTKSNTNILVVELTPQTSKSGNTYFKSKIEVIPTVNPSAAAIAKMHDDTPNARIQEKTDEYDVAGLMIGDDE
jgi:hypothetical protein